MWGCSSHRNRGTCDNGVRIREANVERAVLRTVKHFGFLSDSPGCNESTDSPFYYQLAAK